MKRKLALVKSTSATPAKPGAKGLLTDVRELILSARQSVARTVNATLALHYWEVGRRIRQDILKEKRADYGAEIVVTLSRQLEREFGRGYADKNLRRMVQFAEVFPAAKIVAALGRQLEREFGRGFNGKNLWRTLQFAEVFPDRKIVVSLIRELSWTHFLRLVLIEGRLRPDFRAEW